MSPERMQVVEDAFKEANDTFKKRMKEITVQMLYPKSVHVAPNAWRGISKENVSIRLCGLTEYSGNITAVNVAFSKDGVIKPHIHDRTETTFVVDGEYTDTVTNKVYKAGDVQHVPPGTLHGSKSDYCLLTVVWRPAYNERVDFSEDCD